MLKDQPSENRLLVTVLILMSLLGIFPLDVILPSFPALSSQFSVPTPDIAWSISLFAVGAALSQCWIGPLSDRLGRKRLLLVGLITAASGAVGCIYAWDFSSFMVFRLVQAAGCGCFVLSHALVQDLYSDHRRNSMRILLTTASGLFISLSPLAGSFLQQWLGWQGSFQAFVVLAALAVLLCSLSLTDASRPVAPRSGYRTLFKDRRFISYSLLSAMAFACHFSFIVTSPLLFMDLLGMTDYAFSLIFIAYGAAYIIGGVVASALNKRIEVSAQIRLGLLLIGVAGLSLFLWLYVLNLTVTGIMLSMVVCSAGTTIVRPAATTWALSLHPEIAETAAALNNTLVFTLGGLCSAGVALAEGDLLQALAMVFVLAALIGSLLLGRLRSLQSKLLPD